MRAATGLAEHLNMMHQVRRGHRSIALRDIDEQTNGELQPSQSIPMAGLTAGGRATSRSSPVGDELVDSLVLLRAKPLATLTSSSARS